MGKERAFLELDRRDAPYRPVAERVRDFNPVELPMPEADVCAQAARCMTCGTPFCHAAQSGCPLSNIIPEFNEEVWRGRWKEALDLLLHTNCFPEFTGRVCPAPCESACVLGLIRPPVNICKIELAIIEQGFQRGYVCAQPPRRRRRQRVAVIGSGPAGLAAAYVLNRSGFPVTVFERAPKPGGLLRYGIPDFKLDKAIVDRRVNLMRQEGVAFECGSNTGDEAFAALLKTQFAAVVLATGAQTPRDLRVPGRELKGIHFALEYLTQQNRLNEGEVIPPEQRITAAGKHVVVIGGGDTGADCIGTAWRQGAVSVTQLEILPEPPPSRSPSTPWPLWPLMRRDSTSHYEGPTTRHWNASTREFYGREGHVRGLRVARVEWLNTPNHPAPQPREIAGSEFDLEADLVLLAMGFTAPSPTPLVGRLGVECDERGFVRRNEDHMTNVQGVFVAGDMHRGASLVVNAIADGMRTAERVRAWLET